MLHRLSRRAFAVTAAGGLAFPATRTDRAVATPIASPVASGGDVLAIADPGSARISMFALPSLTSLGTIEDVAVQTHAGFLPLADGSLLFVDEANARLVQVAVRDGTPAIVNEAAVPAEVSHIAVDPGLTWAAVGSADPLAPVTLVDLATWQVTTVALTDTGEVGLVLGSDPAMLYHRNDVLLRLEAYPIDALLAGDLEPTSTVETGAFGHGESFDPESGHVYIATDDGVDVVHADGPDLAYEMTIPWIVGDQEGGRGYFQRLTFDRSYVVSYTADRSAPETTWDTWSNDLWIADSATNVPVRTDLGPGYVYRFALAASAALFYRLHPDGDEAIVVDLATGSPDFGTVTARIPLQAMTNGPKAGVSPYETEFRATGITPDGSLGFVSAGGDGRVDVIDLATMSIVAALDVPGTLAGGGAIVTFGTAADASDTIAR